ncbi:MAG: hypothetical protein JOZ10_19300 [Acidobacteria bacterium]|nr:hypothetical protein [Acidobacteriota bacterium]MBV9145105.1 hypothetical protein [Acidobacteriota bacterium]MBV9435383.1 hypothetical protein [Acidobacteriota bacterium]
MVPLTALWLPIVLAAVIVFVGSSILHMVLRYHRSDYRQIQKEESVLISLRDAGVTRGVYMFPYVCGFEEHKKPEVQAKFRQGPVGILTVLPNGQMNMGLYLGRWFVYCLVVSFFVAYLTGRTLPPGTHYLQVFRVAGTAAFMTYGLAQIGNYIWGGQPGGNTTKHVLDGLIYGLLTAGTFGWLWPH